MPEAQTQTPAPPIAPRDAIAKALAAAREYYADQDARDIALEEVQVSDDGRQWLITVGLSIPVSEPENIYSVLLGLGKDLSKLPKYHRIYKVFAINRLDGTVVSMKIRNS